MEAWGLEFNHIPGLVGVRFLAKRAITGHIQFQLFIVSRKIVVKYYFEEFYTVEWLIFRECYFPVLSREINNSGKNSTVTCPDLINTRNSDLSLIDYTLFAILKSKIYIKREN